MSVPLVFPHEILLWVTEFNPPVPPPKTPSQPLAVMSGRKHMATASGTALCNYFWPSFKPFPLLGERCVTTYDKKANKLSIQNNGIHQRRGRHTCLAPRTMPHCLFIRCQKSLCLLGDSDSNLILFISFFYYFFGEWGGISSFRERRRKDG